MACTNAIDTDVPTPAQSGSYFSYSNKITITTAEPAITGTELLCWRYTSEGYEWRRVHNQEFTLSFWFKSTKSGNYGLGLNNYGPGSVPDRALVRQFFYLAGSGWQKYTFQIPASPTSGTWQLTTLDGIRMYITLASGSTYQNATQNTWNTVATYNCAPDTITNNAADTVGNSFWLTGVQVEQGTQATPFDCKPYGAELSLCQRYCYVLDGAQGYYPRTGWGSFTNGGNTNYQWGTAPVIMRTPGAAINATHNVTTGLTNGTPSSTGISIYNNQAALYAYGTYSSFSSTIYSGGSIYLALTGSSMNNSTAGQPTYMMLGSGVKIVYNDDF